VLVAFRLIAPGSEWRLHREWFERSALADLLGADFGLAEIDKLCACHDHLLAYKQVAVRSFGGPMAGLFNTSLYKFVPEITGPESPVEDSGRVVDRPPSPRHYGKRQGWNSVQCVQYGYCHRIRFLRPDGHDRLSLPSLPLPQGLSARSTWPARY
jgi:hypothetical protein